LAGFVLEKRVCHTAKYGIKVAKALALVFEAGWQSRGLAPHRPYQMGTRAKLRCAPIEGSSFDAHLEVFFSY
jgi:hypothetical protein